MPYIISDQQYDNTSMVSAIRKHLREHKPKVIVSYWNPAVLRQVRVKTAVLVDLSALFPFQLTLDLSQLR